LWADVEADDELERGDEVKEDEETEAENEVEVELEERGAAGEVVAPLRIEENTGLLV